MTPAEQAEWASAMAMFAACIRKNGVPSFPNPELGKPPAGDGIDPSSPLVQRAFKVCQSQAEGRPAHRLLTFRGPA